MSTLRETEHLPSSTYSSVSIALHWLITFMIVGSMTSGTLLNYVDKATAAEIMMTHKPAGFTILMLSVIRLLWRLAHRAPPLPPSTPAWNVSVAHASHIALYALMVGVPLAGWVAASSRGGFSYFGLFDVPALPLPEGILQVGGATHAALVIGMLGLIAIHVAGALKHHFINRDSVLVRMLPKFGRSSATGVRANAK